MKNYKSIIAILLAFAIVFSLAACQKKNAEEEETSAAQYEEVTDENGEPVTDENGEVVTVLVTGETELKTEPNGETTSKESGNDNKSSDKSTTETTTQKTVSKPSAPKNVTGLKTSDITEDSITLKWDGVDCDGYQVYYSVDNVKWQYLDKKCTKNTYKVTGLEAYTEYYFCVRAYNTNSAGTATSKWTDVVSATTKETSKARKITINIKLPFDSNKTDYLYLSVDGEWVAEGTEVKLDGKTFTYTTKKEYKGAVQCTAHLEGVGGSQNGIAGGDHIDFDFTAIGIDTVYDYDEDFN